MISNFQTPLTCNTVRTWTGWSLALDYALWPLSITVCFVLHHQTTMTKYVCYKSERLYQTKKNSYMACNSLCFTSLSSDPYPHKTAYNRENDTTDPLLTQCKAVTNLFFNHNLLYIHTFPVYIFISHGVVYTLFMTLLHFSDMVDWCYI